MRREDSRLLVTLVWHFGRVAEQWNQRLVATRFAANADLYVGP